MNTTLTILILSQMILNVLLISLIITVNDLKKECFAQYKEFLKQCKDFIDLEKITTDIEKSTNKSLEIIGKEYRTIESVMNILLDRTNPKNKE